jgi:hypothetical protein
MNTKAELSATLPLQKEAHSLRLLYMTRELPIVAAAPSKDALLMLMIVFLHGNILYL